VSELRSAAEDSFIIRWEGGNLQVPLRAYDHFLAPEIYFFFDIFLSYYFSPLSLPPSPDIDFDSYVPVDFGSVNHKQIVNSTIKIHNKGLKFVTP
jgi:hypothetical protein